MAVPEFTTQELKPKERTSHRGAKRSGKTLECEQCGAPYYVPRYRATTAQYCSRTCKGKAVSERPEVRAKRANIAWPTGPKHHNWKGGKTIDVHGYVVLSLDGQRVKEHRYVMQEHLGRTLQPNEIVHHINGIKTDNRIENLEVMTQSAHVTEHQFLHGKWAKFYDCCIDCGTTNRPHVVRGRCKRCHRRNEARNPETVKQRREYRRARYRALRDSGVRWSKINV